MASAIARTCMGAGGVAPSGVQGQRPWSGDQEGEAPLKLTTFSQLKDNLNNENFTFSALFMQIMQLIMLQFVQEHC